MEIIKTIHKHYTISDVTRRPFMMYGRWREIRENLGMKYNKTCFVCGHKFKDNEPIYLAFTNKGNQLVCEKCKDEILKSNNQ